MKVIYDKGINLTHWKSSMPENSKVKELRELLRLPVRKELIARNQFDKEVVDDLRSIDFSELDDGCLSSCFGWHNTKKDAVLTFAGWGLVDVGSEATQVTGDHAHAD